MLGGEEFLPVNSWNETYKNCKETTSIGLMILKRDPVSRQFKNPGFMKYLVNEANSTVGNLLKSERYIDMSDKIDSGLVSFCRNGMLTSRNILVPISDQRCSDIYLQIEDENKYYQLEGDYPEPQSNLDCTNQVDVNKKAIQGLIRKRRSDQKKIRDLKLDLNILCFVSRSALLVFFCRIKFKVFYYN